MMMSNVPRLAWPHLTVVLIFAVFLAMWYFWSPGFRQRMNSLNPLIQILLVISLILVLLSPGVHWIRIKSPG